MIDQIIKDTRPKMELSLEILREGLSKIRTGRANASILDGVMVSSYGTMTNLKEVASITIPEPNQIYIKPWDKNVISSIESAIRSSDIGLAPINDGVAIRLILPPMTEERRKQIANQVKKLGEDAKISIRNIRGEAWSRVQQAEKNKDATEDDRYRGEEELNKITNEMNKEIDIITAEKEVEIMKI